MVVVAVAANGETEKEERGDFAGKSIIKYFFFLQYCEQYNSMFRIVL